MAGGAYCPTLDKLEAGLELIRDAAVNSGLTLGEDISILIDVGAERLYDQVCIYMYLIMSSRECVCTLYVHVHCEHVHMYT